jgi:DNA-binding transcriptional MerR regulator
MNKEEDRIKIGDLAGATQVSASVIRHWVDLGLMEGTYEQKPLHKAQEIEQSKAITGKNIPRRYLKSLATSRIEEIKRLKEKTNLSLKEIKKELRKK